MLSYLKRFGGAVPRTVDKLRKREKLFVHIRSKEAWEQDYRQHKWDQLVTKFTEAGNLAIIGFMLAFAIRKQHLRLLDVGCGNGALLKLLQGLTAKVSYTGADISAESLAQLKAQYPEVETICADMSRVEEIPGRYDVIIFNECLYYTDYDAVIDHYRTKLEQDGLMIISMVNNAGRGFIWRRIESKMDALLSFTVRNDHSKDTWTVKLLSYN
jgi:2-polyprenyl-3-methyl-5-hydroxy-6-metoxy-1,4-benzoquinol methylase